LRVKKATSFAIEKDLADQINEEAKRLDISRSELLRRVFTAYFAGPLTRRTNPSFGAVRAEE
jgi:DNA-binding Lrp family transcriptional regulator